MHITKRQSIIIAIGAIVGFFLVGLAFLQTNQRRISLASSSKPPSLSDSDSMSKSGFAQQSSAQEQTSSANSSDPVSVSTMKNFHRIEAKGGKTIWEVNGSRGEYFQESNSAKIFDVLLKIYDKDGKKSELSADQAEIFLSGPTLGRAHAKNNVKVTTHDDTVLVTDEAFYDKSKNTITTAGPVKITNPRAEVTADKLDGDVEKQIFTLSGDVLSIIKPK